MQVIDAGSCRTSSGAADQATATPGLSGSRGSPQERADQLVRATVLSDLGQGNGRHHGHGIQAIAGAIFRSLSGQDVTGTDAADDVLKKIETSLHKAAQALADRGVDAKTIDATIDKFRSQLANALDRMGGASGSGSTSTNGSSGSTPSTGDGSSGTTSSSGADGSSSAPAPVPAPSGTTTVSQFVAREVRKERGAIDLVTAEGDRVSIRFRTKEVVAGSVTQATGADGTSVTAAKSSVFARGGVKIEVDGNLNADELKAIGDLLGKVDDIANKFFSGDVQAAFTAASSLGVDSDQIAAYRLNLTYSRKIAAVYGAIGATAPASSTQTPASTPTSGGTPPAASTTTSAPDSSGNASSTSTSTPASDTTAGASATDSAQKTLLDFINDALSKLASANGAGRITFSTHWKVSVLMTALQSVQPMRPTTGADQTAASNTQLLGDSLQKIATA